MYKPETKKEADNTRKIAFGFVALIGISLLLLIAKMFGIF